MSATASSPLVSVVVPLFNHGQWLRYCLDSVLAADWGNIELLVNDDCSSDDSYEVATAWAQKQEHSRLSIRVMRFEVNQGLTRSLNHLIEQADGEYVCVLASDDALLPNGIRDRVEALQQRPDWSAVFGDATAMNSKNLQLHESCLFELGGMNRKRLVDDRLRRLELIARWKVPGPVLMLRREAFDPNQGKQAYDESKTVEDYEFYLRIATSNKLGFVDSVVAQYRLRDKGAGVSEARRNTMRAELSGPLLSLAANSRIPLSERAAAFLLGKRMQYRNRKKVITSKRQKIAFALAAPLMKITAIIVIEARVFMTKILPTSRHRAH